MQESRDDQIKLHDDDAEVLEKLMGYMKEDSVSFFSGGRSHDLHHLEYMRLYMLAEKYGFPVLVYIIADELHRLAVIFLRASPHSSRAHTNHTDGHHSLPQGALHPDHQHIHRHLSRSVLSHFR